MNAFFEFVTNNALVSTLVAFAILAAVSWLWKARRDRKDSEAIYSFLAASKAQSGFVFRSTEAIASHTKIHEERVAILCARHPKIRRNEKERQSWTLTQ